MMTYAQLDASELTKIRDAAAAKLKEYASAGKKLDLTLLRGRI